MVSGAAAAPDAALPDAQTLRARMAAAAGEPNLNYRETIVGNGNDGRVIRTHYRRAHDELTRVTRGPIHFSYGTERGVDWHQNANGITVLDRPEAPSAGALKTVSIVKRVSTPFDAYVVSELDAGGYGVREYVDPRTYLVMRSDAIGRAGTTTTTNTAFARFGTQVLPAAWRVEDRAFDDDTAYTRTRFVVGRTNVADIARPPARRTCASAPKCRWSTRISAVLTAGV